MNNILIDDIAGLDNIKEQWNALCLNNSSYEPFQCYEWHDVWIKHFLKNNRLAIVTGYCQNELQVIAPLYLKNSKVKGVSINKLEMIGNVYSPIRNFLCDSSSDAKREDLTSFILGRINNLPLNWDVMDLSCVPEENHLYDIMKQSVKRLRLSFLEYNCFVDWYQDTINCSWDDFFLQLPDKIRKDILYCRRRLEREGNISFAIINSLDGLDNFVDQYYSVYSRSWQKQENLGPNFHRDLAKMAAEKGWLRLGFLLYNGNPIAAQFWIVANSTAYILKTVYDQQYKKYSPGKLLTAEMMKSAIDSDRVTTIDYVQGDEEYKKDWTPKRRERKGILVYNTTLKGRYLSIVDRKISPLIGRNRYLRKLKQAITAGLNPNLQNIVSQGVR